MDKLDSARISALNRPPSGDSEAWKLYWEAQGQSWRTEPEIDRKHQEELAQHHAIIPDIKKGIYPFKGIRLNRADIEWLLATHGNGRGPAAWNYNYQSRGKGLDLRGADLHSVNLYGLPLVCICGGLSRSAAIEATFEERQEAKIHLEGANLAYAHLEGADLAYAHLEGADLAYAHLEGADLYRAHLEGAYFKEAYLGGTSIRSSFLDASTVLNDVKLEDEKLGCLSLGDVHWRDVNLSRVNWARVKMLGDENEARRPSRWDGKKKDQDDWFLSYQWAVRANRQLAVVLQGQGLNEESAHFAYRAQKLQRVVLQRQRKFLQYLFSSFLDLIAGYGYRPLRSVLWYLVTLIGFAFIYFAFGHLSLWPPDAFIYSLTSFHGRGFFPGLEGKPSLHDPLIMFAAIEAVVGLFIEISFIATFTQRFFGK